MFANFPSKKGVGFLALLAAVIAILIRKWSHDCLFEEKPKHYYDYIIVGGGTGGSILAHRLSENPEIRVLVVEAGQDEPWISSIPFLAPAVQMTSADWGFKTTTQKYALWGFHEQKANWPRGKGMGGSSAINFLMHSWGSKEDFDSWKKDFGCVGWDYGSVKRYFLKQEAFRSAEGTSRSHRGKEGALPVSEFDVHKSPISEAFLKAAQQVGFEKGDLNGQLDQGIMPSQSNILGGKRWSSYKAFLKPILDRPNIDVIIEGYVTKVRIEGRKAVGIEMLKIPTGEYFYVRAQEVILSAGTVGSPHILMHSGIGNRKVLEKVGIPTVSHVPGVGKNLQDHLNVPVYFHIDKPFSINTAKVKSLRQIANHFLYGDGIFSWNAVEAWARTTMRTGNGNTTSQLPSDVLVLLFNVGSVHPDLFAKIANMKDHTFLESFPETHNESKEGFMILSFCSHPRSKGEITLVSSDPFIAPKINPHYLENPYDVNCTAKAIKLAMKIAGKEPLKALGAKLHLPDFSECSRFKKNVHDWHYLRCWIRVAAMTAYHPTGTCKMGSDDDPLAVVDSELRVRGVQNLRVVDASIFPRILSGPLHSGVLMVAEKAADMILHSRTLLHDESQSSFIKHM